MNKIEILKRIDQLIEQGRVVLSTKKSSEFSGNYIDMGQQMGFRSASLSFIKNLYGETHPYFKDFNERVKGQAYYETENGINILIAIRNEVDNDWLISIKKLISAEIFSDFFEMSKYLLDQRYKDPAAVMIGSVLEEHLRLLCRNHSVQIDFLNNSGNTVSKKADTLNADLVKAGVYGLLEQKQVTAWLDLRNKAAHGKYSEYSQEHVELMYQGVLNFLLSTK